MNKYLVEFLGTLFFAFTIFTTSNYLAIGASLALVVLLGGDLCAYNPAVAIAFLYAGKIGQNDLVPYIVAEIAGALVGLELAKLVLNRKV
jgi:glycerol uptake facilitator-like aquaporin